MSITEYLVVQNYSKDVCTVKWYDPEGSPELDVGINL